MANVRRMRWNGAVWPRKRRCACQGCKFTLKIERRLDIACQPSIPGSVSDIPGMNVVSIKAINIAR
jgi:hypothetical protein